MDCMRDDLGCRCYQHLARGWILSLLLLTCVIGSRLVMDSLVVVGMLLPAVIVLIPSIGSWLLMVQSKVATVVVAPVSVQNNIASCYCCGPIDCLNFKALFLYFS